MKKFFKQIISCIVLIIVAVAFVGYIINYRAAGELSFVSRNTPIYSTSDLNKQIYTLNCGDSFVALSNFDSNSVKIRFQNAESDQEEIGFISSYACNSYIFPLSDAYRSVSKPSVILSLQSKTTFDVFIKQFVNSIEDYDVVGIYLEDSDYSEERSNLLEISSFCEELHIPYGFISSFTDSEVEYYIDSNTVNDTYCILPHVFDIGSIADNYHFDKKLSECIFRTASIRNDNIQRYWITSGNSHSISEPGILLMNSEETNHVMYISVSDELKVEILDRYTEIEGN